MGPLSGVRVLEMCSFISGPYACMLLADLGAEVTKVEAPEAGDPFRYWQSNPGVINSQFAAYNRGKRSVTMDVKRSEGRDAFLKLAAEVDVVVENFRPGTTDRLGIGYDAIQRRNPGVVYCLITGMGSTGPLSHLPTYDAIAQARSGLWSLLTDIRDPKPVGPAMSDQLTGVFAAYGVLGALVARGRTGVGQKIEVSMLSATLSFLTSGVSRYLMEAAVWDHQWRPRESQSYAFLAGDSLPFAIHLSSPPKFWQGLARAAGRVGLVDDPRFRTKADRVRHYDVLHDILSEVFATHPRVYWIERLQEQDVPCAPIYTLAEAVGDPQAQHLEMVRRFGEGERAVDLVGFPVQFSGTPLAPGLPPPLLGEHTQEVLQAPGRTPAASDTEQGIPQAHG